MDNQVSQNNQCRMLQVSKKNIQRLQCIHYFNPSASIIIFSYGLTFTSASLIKL